MFNKQEEKITNVKEAETIIGKSVKVKGNFHGDGNIIIEGEVDGSVKTNNYLLVGPGASIKASIKAKDAKIAGKIIGDINIQGYLELESTAKIKGNIFTGQLSIERGAVLNGNVNMGGADSEEIKTDKNKE